MRSNASPDVTRRRGTRRSITEEERRHDLVEALRRAIGPTHTGTLMGYLPPVGWADVATKQDLAHQDALLQSELGRVHDRLSGRIEALPARIDTVEARFEARLHDVIRRQTLTLLTAMTALMGMLATLTALF